MKIKVNKNKNKAKLKKLFKKSNSIINYNKSLKIKVFLKYYKSR